MAKSKKNKKKEARMRSQGTKSNNLKNVKPTTKTNIRKSQGR